MLSFVKDSKIYIILEIFLLVADIYSYCTSGSFYLLFVIGIVFFYLIDKLIKHFQFKKALEQIPNKLRFMIEFIHTIGYDNPLYMNKIKDKNHHVNRIIKEYTINMSNCTTQKTYEGYVLSNISDGLRIMTCGGSSISLENIHISSYDFLEDKFVETKFNPLDDNERTKTIKLPFDHILSKNDFFKVRYKEEDWSGAMRNDYDGIVIAEHLLFKEIIEQIIYVNFLSGKIKSIEIYSYNIDTHIVKKTEKKVEVNNGKYKWSTSVQKHNIIYFLFYTYE